MKNSLCLNGIWQLTYAEGSQLSAFEEFAQVQPAVGRRLLDAQVPSPIHRELEKNGLTYCYYDNSVSGGDGGNTGSCNTAHRGTLHVLIETEGIYAGRRLCRSA